MLSRRILGIPVLLVVALVLPAAALALGLRAVKRPRAAGHTAATSKRAHVMPASTSTTGVAEVGALFSNASSPEHNCTASVVDSPHGDLLLTAAHCVSGSGAGMIFAPGLHGDTAPYGRWVVTAAHLAPGWLKRQDPREDYAFLTVAPQTIDGVRTEIQQVTGAYRLGTTATSGERITVPGDPAGTDNDPITCTTTTYMAHGFPSFDCRGYVSGTSGSPWLADAATDPTIVGVIGGLNQGGCVDYTSYSSPLDQTTRIAYARASDEVAGDVAPAPDGDGC